MVTSSSSGSDDVEVWDKDNEPLVALLSNIEQNKTSTSSEGHQYHFCYTPLHVWTMEIQSQSHLSTVIHQSGIVGLFDIPYTYLTTQVVQLANDLRSSSHCTLIVAMTERDPMEWATSRLRNHGVFEWWYDWYGRFQ